MSGVDVASSIAGLITLALQVSNAIAKYTIAVKDHAKNVKEFQDELLLLGTVLSKLSDFIQSEKAKGRSFDQDSVLVNAIRDCKQRIERIGDKIKTSDGSRLSRAFDKLKWPFEQKDVMQHIENLRRYTHTFEFALTIDSREFLSQSWGDAIKKLEDLQKKVNQACETNKLLGVPIDSLLERSVQLQRTIDILPQLLQNDIKEVSQAVRDAEQREQERRKTEILDWLTPLSALHKHIELQNRRAPGTCKWLLQSEIFLDWVESDGQFDMLCQGGPGVGKTVLCSMVTDHLREKCKSDEVAVAYYYFDLTEQQSQTEHSLARSILRQLCQSFRTIPTSVAEFYQRTRNELQDSLWLQELMNILQKVITTFNKCYFVVDAFDEIDAKKRGSLYRVLDTIRASSGCVKIFATSRPHVILNQFQEALKLDVRADDDDLRDFLSQKIDAHPHAVDIIDADLKERTLNRLCQHADGVFLLPALQIDQILDEAVSPGDIERALLNLSTDLKEVFRSTIVRIEGFFGAKRDLAFKTLMWLSHARRPLRISELQHAIAVRADSPDVDSRDISAITLILDSCCGLIELDGESASIRFVHGSIAEYLQDEDHGFFQNAELEIVRVCLKYLTMDQLRNLPFKSRTDFIKSMEFFPFLEYASSYWGYHARGLDVSQYADLATPFLKSGPHLLVTARVKDVQTPELRKWKDRMLAWSLSGGAGISLAASFGLTDLTLLLINQSQSPMLAARNMYGSTPLHECAILGDENTAKVLIAHGADLLDSNMGKATPFYLAVSYGQLGMCQMLLNYNRSQLDVPCRAGNTALHKAADLGNESMVEFLLRSGALVEAPNQLKMTALHLAARNGNMKVVQMLVTKGASTQAVSSSGVMPLDLAVNSGYSDVVEYLLQNGASVSHKDRENWTSLHKAARSGNTDSIKMLLAAGADVLALDRQRCMPLQLAVKSGSLEAVKTILYHDSAMVVRQLKHKDWKKDRAIDVAFYTSHYHIYEFIRDVENDIIVRDANLPTDPLLPLIRLIEQGEISEVENAIAANPEWLTAKDFYDQTPLHTAFRTRNREIAEFLLLQGASINSRGYHGWTPLHIAAATGDVAMLTLALQWNADIFLVSDTLQTVLHKASSSHSIEVLTELLRCGCLPSAVNDKAMTAVHTAARQNFIEGVLIMIQPEYGGRILLFQRDAYGRTPRDWAEKVGHLELSSVLRDEERRAKGRLSSHNSSTMSVANRSVSGNAYSSNGQSSRLSRQSTKDSMTTYRSNSTSLTVPSFERSNSARDSIDSLDDTTPCNSGISSPRRSPRIPSPRITSPKSPTPVLSQEPSVLEIEQRYNEMQLEFDESD